MDTSEKVIRAQRQTNYKVVCGHAGGGSIADHVDSKFTQLGATP